MIEPIHGKPGSYDVSCSACGIVERIEAAAFRNLVPFIKARGWRFRPGRHYCPDCKAPAS